MRNLEIFLQAKYVQDLIIAIKSISKHLLFLITLFIFNNVYLMLIAVFTIYVFETYNLEKLVLSIFQVLILILFNYTCTLYMNQCNIKYVQ